MGGRLRFEDGQLEVPREPGLGIALDYDMLEMLHDNFINCGISRRDDTAEMKKIDPDWKFKATRW